jgi:hypothetical protein
MRCIDMKSIKINTKKLLMNLLIASSLLFLMGGNALADVGMKDFSSSGGTDGLGDAKPLMMEVVGIVVSLFLVTCVISVFGSGSTANVGNLLHNASMRSKGIMGVVTVLGVVFAVIVVLVLFFHMYNKYLA